MPPSNDVLFDSLPPTYDETQVASSLGDRNLTEDEAVSSSPIHNADARLPDESRRLLPQSGLASRFSRPAGYRPPTVETDDEDSLWGGTDSDLSDDPDAETAQVRREIQEMEVEEPSQSRASAWGKRIALSLSLPRWKWSWPLKLPRLRIRLPSRFSLNSTQDQDGGNAAAGSHSSDGPRPWLRVDKLTLVLIFARVLVLFIVIGLIYVLFSSGFFGGLPSRLGGTIRFDPEDLRTHICESVEARRLRASVKHFSSYAHIAGSEGDFATALDVESMFSRAGLDTVTMDEYYVYLNYPRKDGRTVQIMDSKGKEPIWTAKLEEDERGTETAGRQTYAFHGHSRSGDVRGPLIYANYGSRQDFARLKELGVPTEGAIALVRYYGSQGDVALKVKAAELAGFAGCLAYSDPADNGFHKGDVAPGGRYIPADGVQRGSVSLTSRILGDVLTPGWESKKGVPRMKMNDTTGLVEIPSLPLAWRDAQMLLQHLKGHGKKVPDGWKGGVPEVEEWWTGDQSSPVVRLRNEQDEQLQQPIWNVYGKIVGAEQSTKSIILGNHRDAWAFGATDPHGGTAIMIELARIFGDLLRKGWRPLRTIEFMSWDGGEYNLIGSTEFTEMKLDSLRQDAYAYINLDAVAAGTELRAAGSPPLERALFRALGRVKDPNANATLAELWKRRGSQLGSLGAGSDYAALQNMAGTSCLDLAFAGDMFPGQSSYDDFDLVEKVIDPGFVYHTLMGQLVGLVVLDLADRPVVPFDMMVYGQRLVSWVEDLEKWAKESGKSGDLSFRELREAAVMVKDKADEFVRWEMQWDRLVLASGGWEPNDLGTARLRYNDKMAAFDTALLDLEFGGGIPNRTQFKHVVFGPQLWSSRDPAYFPAIRDSLEAGDADLTRRIVAKTAAILRTAAAMLDL